MSNLPNFWVVIPAAGSARRMASDIPKQYLQIAGRAVIEHAMAPFLAMRECRGIVVALAVEDVRFRSLAVAADPRVRTAAGGAERVDSVRAALESIEADEREWVLVHDAARPCLSAQDLNALLSTLRDDDVGGLLAAPVVDTLKRAGSDERVTATVDRSSLWHALTPQMFRYGVLRRALASAGAITDDSQAVEALGLAPKLVRGSAENLKITVPDDLARAERILLTRNLR
jgi:2-C-methyl-D-erythritol 4-phosphate cytidylyltransferase